MPAERVPDFVRNIRGLMDDVAAMPQPTVAVVQGFAFGGGTELMLACDLRIAAAEASFGLTETTLAIIPGAGGTQRLPRLIGASRAKDLILTGRKLDATEAERIGLVNRVARAPISPRRRPSSQAPSAGTAPSPSARPRRRSTAAPRRPWRRASRSRLAATTRCCPRPTGSRPSAAFAEKRRPRYTGS